jgi:cellobiose transport system permease protein
MAFRGSGWLFGVAILVILVPKQALAVPLFEWMAWLGWQGDLWSLALPGVASGLGVIFFTQVFRKVPDELIDLAKVVGLSPVRTFATLLPLITPALVTFCFLHFILSWQEHLLPLLMLDDENLTLPIALAKLRDSSHRIPESVGMAAATLSLIPVVLLFGLCFRKMKTALVELSLS